MKKHPAEYEYNGITVGGLNNLLECSESARLYFMNLPDDVQSALMRSESEIRSESHLRREGERLSNS